MKWLENQTSSLPVSSPLPPPLPHWERYLGYLLHTLRVKSLVYLFRSVDHNQSRRIPSPKTPPLPTSPHRRQLLLQTAAAAAKNKRLRADAEPEIQEVQQILMQSLPASKSRRTLSTESPNKSHSQEKNASDKNDPTTTSSNPSSVRNIKIQIQICQMARNSLINLKI